MSRFLKRLGKLLGSGNPNPAKRDVPLASYDASFRQALSELPSQVQAAFAAACAERLYPPYVAFLEATGRSDGGDVRRALDLAWTGATTGFVDDPDPRALVERCVALIPDVDSEDSIPPYADDAIAAAAYALQAAAGLDTEAAGRAARRVTDALDSFVQSADQFDINESGSEQLLWRHPLVVAEVARRERDLRTLSETPDWSVAVEAVRAEATRSSALPLERLDHEA